MRVFATILAIVIVGIGFVPCADGVATLTSNDIHHADIDTHSENDHHTNHCSPLCVCGCCNTVVTSITQDLIQEIPFFDNTIKEKDDFILPIVRPIYFAIWQPPQIV